MLLLNVSTYLFFSLGLFIVDKIYIENLGLTICR